MIFKKAKLSQQIFISMIALVSFSMLIIAIINIQQIQKETKTYNIDRLSRKDRAVAKSIEAIINLSSIYNVNLENAFRPIVEDVGFIHKLKINIYNLEGKFIWSSDTTLLKNLLITEDIPKILIDSCFTSKYKKINYVKEDYFGTYRILYKNPEATKLTSSEPSLTGMPFCILDVVYDKSTKDDITKAVKIFRDANCPFELMHCISTYPMDERNANLNCISTLRDEFKCDVGYSGHEPGLAVSYAAAAVGITSLERHITLDRTLWGTDQSASLAKYGI